jgi:hypothetical protein
MNFVLLERFHKILAKVSFWMPLSSQDGTVMHEMKHPSHFIKKVCTLKTTLAAFVHNAEQSHLMDCEDKAAPRPNHIRGNVEIKGQSQIGLRHAGGISLKVLLGQGEFKPNHQKKSISSAHSFAAPFEH